MKPEAKPGPGPPAPASFLSFVSQHSDKLLAAVPFVFLVWVVARCAVAVPYADEWELVPLLDKMYRGDLGLSDLWAQRNEHRPLVSQLIMLGLARLTAWNIRYELAANVALAFAVFAVLAGQIKATGRMLAVTGLRWAIPLSSLIVFSISQYQVWLWGYAMGLPLNLLAVVGGIVLLAQPAFAWRRFVASAALGIVATYSFANGVLFWPIGLGILLIVTRGRRERITGLAIWTSVSLLTLGSYFWHYQKPAGHPSLSLVFKMPLAYARYVFEYLGSICAQYATGAVTGDGDLALAFGLLGTVAWVWAAWRLMRPNRARFRLLLPYLAMSAYSIGTALVTGVGRVGFGADEALASRYCVMVVPLWVSLIVFLVLLAHPDDQPAKAGSRPKPGKGWQEDYRTVAAGLLVAGLTASLALSSVCATEGAGSMSKVLEHGRLGLLDLAAHPETEINFSAPGPYTDLLVKGYPVLVKYHLSVFSKGPSTQPQMDADKHR